MWQNNERKARFIAAALSGDTSIRRLEDMGEGQANQFAMAKAIASGDERLMQKAGLEADIARLERLRAAHEDDLFAVRRQVRDAEREIETATRRIVEIGQDIERLVPTSGEAFTMAVTGKPYTERKDAGRALMKEILTLVQLQQESKVHIATVGSFDLVYDGEKFGRSDNYRYQTLLQRTGADRHASGCHLAPRACSRRVRPGAGALPPAVGGIPTSPGILSVAEGWHLRLCR